MPRKFIDLSVSLQEGIKSDPDFMLPKINYHHHNETAEEMISFFPGLKKEDLPGGEGWAMETITVSTHNGTHMDAPYHYHSTMDNGTRAITIDEVPLEWCFSDGVKLDLRSYDDGYVLTESDIKSELKKINYKLKPLDIVFVNTSAGECYGQDDFLSKGCGIGREATIFLLDQNKFTLGYGSQNDFILNGYAEVCNLHAHIYKKDNQVFIENEEEGSEILVNYRQIDQQAMKKGDVIKIGTALLQYYEI